jgi:hypothetical protein
MRTIRPITNRVAWSISGAADLPVRNSILTGRDRRIDHFAAQLPFLAQKK